MAPKMAKPSKFMEAFMKRRNVAAWFRGTSAFQIKAADNLQNALRDDREQNTTHRVQDCLQSIGVDPMISSKSLKAVMRISRGNDLAFLFALLELFYKTPGCTYTLNEQLIMSTICHLDMIPTLRELDRILPPGHQSLAIIEKQRRAAARQNSAKERLLRQKPKKPAVLPYFEKLVRPRCLTTQLHCSMPRQTTTIEPYEDYLDPHYEPGNVERWFAEYQLRPADRIAKKILWEELDKIFNDYDAVLEKANNTEIICEKHFQEYLRDLQKHDQAKVKEKQRCLELLQINKRIRDLRNARIIKKLEHDIECNRTKFRQQERDKIFNVKVISGKSLIEDKFITVGHKDPFLRIMNEDLAPCSPCSSNIDIPGHYLKACKCREKECKEKPKTPTPTCKCFWKPEPTTDAVNVSVKMEHTCAGCTARGVKVERQEGGCDILSNTSKSLRCEVVSNNDSQVAAPACCKRSHLAFGSKACARLRRKARNKSKKEQAEANKLETENLNQFTEDLVDMDKVPIRSKQFFTAATEHVPYSFDHECIFRFSDHNDISLNVKRAFVKALDEDNIVPIEKEGQPNVAGAAEQCFKKIFKEGVAEKTAEINMAEEAERAEEMDVLNGSADVVMRHKYPQKYFDPNDARLMEAMLIDAFDLMRRNPYFVLASLPSAHKLPMLREWIGKRYGKTYTKQDRTNFLRESLRFFNELSASIMSVSFPMFTDFKPPNKMTYKQRDCLSKKYNQMKENLFRELDDFIMETSRQFWFAMRPYMLPRGPPRNTYFAYMPARTQEIMHFRLWKPDEYTDYKLLYENRKEKENAANKGNI